MQASPDWVSEIGWGVVAGPRANACRPWRKTIKSSSTGPASQWCLAWRDEVKVRLVGAANGFIGIWS
jgi:hypothetical protein